MALEIQSQNVVLNGGSTPFNFSNPVTQFLAGVASFQLSYGSEDHHVEEMSIQLTTNKPSSNQVNVGANAVLQDASGHNIDLSASYVTVTVIAWTGSPTTFVLLSPSFTVQNDSQSSGITLPAANDTYLQAVVGGFYLSYGDTDHHVNLVETSVSASQSGNIGFISATAGMNDASGNKAVNPSTNGSLIATSLSAPGFVIVPYQGQSTNNPTISMGTPISAAVSFLTGFHVQYADSDDHHVQAIGAGPNKTWVDSSNSSSAQTTGVWAWMYDDSDNNQDNSNSYSSIVVVGLSA